MEKIRYFISSKWFFVATLALFSFEVLWLIFADRFPMAFDESFHFNLVQYFGTHINPIISNQPKNTYNLGALVHDPSILYHYLLSYPYRLTEVFSKSLKVQVIVLRLINLPIALVGLIYARKILSRLSLPASVSNMTIFLYAFTPIVSVLTAQINYDNLVILFATLSIYLMIKVLQDSSIDNIRAMDYIALISLCLFGSLVKFSFLPIFTGIVLALVIYLIKFYRQRPKIFFTKFVNSYRAAGLLNKIVLSSLFVVAIALFINFYGVNLVKYHNLTPQCQQVLTTQDCSKYYPWERNNLAVKYKNTHPGIHHMNAFSYSVYWFKVEYYQLFGEIVPTGGLVYIVKEFYAYIIFISVLAALCFLVEAKYVLSKHKWILPILIVSAVYLLSLLLRNYTNYLQLGKPLAIQGRYLIPVLIYFYSLGTLSVYYFLNKKTFREYKLKEILTVVTIIVFIYFGGFMRYVNKLTPKYGWIDTVNTKNST